MPQKPSKNKHANDNIQAHIAPTDRFDFLAAVSMDHAISARNSLSARVATVALRHRHNQSGRIVLKYKTISQEIGCSVSAVRDAVEVLKTRWFKVSPVYYGDECVANKYEPRWDEAAAVGGLWSVETHRMLTDDEAAEARKENPVIQEDPAVTQEDEAPRSQEDRPLCPGEQTPALQTTDLRPPEDMQNSGSLTHRPKPGGPKPGEIEHSGPPDGDRRARPDLGVARACGADRHGHKTGGYQQSREQAERDWLDLNRVLPGTSEDAVQQPDKDSDRGAKVRWHRWLKSGVPSGEIVETARNYRDHQISKGHWISGVAGFLTKYDPEQPYWTDEDDPAQDKQAPLAETNDNAELDRASGDGSSYGGKCDPDDPF